ncbi:P-loop containing nucleoside triphosphate hydrolase protein [Mycena belliarum]|uniref:P-loop containing nucleoside triphosphate hydrolase protein n=1 Tax=Mycena belliarum TaxID=1033014 RepID=A0AAD6UIU7_9AGAR|nr:P-loop containing nucleoside triphosphate hydrolase protein [Mycena belliae]
MQAIVPPPNMSLQTERIVPMQVLAMGFPRTGTSSLKIALETLGYVRTNHGFTVHTSSGAMMDMWIAAIKAKFFGEGTPFGRAEWDKLLGDCRAVADVPHILFAAELMAAYPDAKVLLTNRSPENWWKSFEATVVESRKPTLFRRFIRWLDPEQTAKSMQLAQLIFRVLFDTDHVTKDIAQARFTAHYEEVRRLAPKSRLLEFEVKEGWGPLAKFLGKEVPATAFPRVNDTEQFKKRVFGMRMKPVRMWAGRIVWALVTAGVPAALLLYYRVWV